MRWPLARLAERDRFIFRTLSACLTRISSRAPVNSLYFIDESNPSGQLAPVFNRFHELTVIRLSGNTAFRTAQYCPVVQASSV